MKKAATGSTAKSGTTPKSGTTTKSGTSHIAKSSLKTSPSLPPVGKLPNIPSVSKKSYTTSSYTPTNKKSTTFGIIWLPTKKRNKHKDLAYNSHRNDHSTGRTPSMYNL